MVRLSYLLSRSPRNLGLCSYDEVDHASESPQQLPGVCSVCVIVKQSTSSPTAAGDLAIGDNNT